MAMGISSVLKGGLHLMGVKDLLEMITGFLDKNKDNPLLRAVIEKVARGLREETLTKEAISRVGGYYQRRIEALQTHLRKSGNAGYLQALRNCVLTYVIFENAEVPLTQAPPSSKVTSSNVVFRLKVASTSPAPGDLSFALAIEFLNDIARHIKEKGTGYDFEPALNRLKDYGFIGQMDKTFWMNVVGKSRVGIEGLLAELKAGGPVMPRVKRFLADEFPETLPADEITPILKGVRTRLQNMRRR